MNIDDTRKTHIDLYQSELEEVERNFMKTNLGRPDAFVAQNEHLGF